MPDILDSIDGALTDYGTSKDAMRWAPPESQPEAEPCSLITVDLRLDVEPFLEALRRTQTVIEEYVAGVVRAMVSAFLPVCRDGAREHAAALSAMHREYRRRSKARQRRKRGR